jgi:hypothetical protein
MIQVADSGPTVGQLLAAILGAIPLLGIVGWTAVKIFSPLTQALARRISGGSEGTFLEQRIEALAQELDAVKAQLADTHERLDFTERMLAQGRQPDQLPRG